MRKTYQTPIKGRHTCVHDSVRKTTGTGKISPPESMAAAAAGEVGVILHLSEHLFDVG
jgi:hypothetical protein